MCQTTFSLSLSLYITIVIRDIRARGTSIALRNIIYDITATFSLRDLIIARIAQNLIVTRRVIFDLSLALPVSPLYLITYLRQRARNAPPRTQTLLSRGEVRKMKTRMDVGENITYGRASRSVHLSIT